MYSVRAWLIKRAFGVGTPSGTVTERLEVAVEQLTERLELLRELAEHFWLGKSGCTTVLKGVLSTFWCI